MLWSNVSTFKHAPFCHYSKSYSKCESNRFSISKCNVNVQAFLSQEDLVLLCNEEKKFCKKLRVSCNTYHDQLSCHDVELATKEVVSSPSTNHAAQDLLLLKDNSMEVVDEEENFNAIKTSLEIPNNEVESDYDNKPAAVEIEIQEKTTTVPITDTVETLTATATVAAPVTSTGKCRSPIATKSKGVVKNKTTAKVRVPQAAKAKLSNVSNEPVIVVKQMRKKLRQKEVR